ncbi:Pogo transposable element-like 1 [Homarus americanus]|uniref:Pogo transposable element-like 1 n=1 Tax=Homarus americanus TaxID=6706 RepID=A0A8J5JYA3_HOMAM|nr:Pogo transposable element-like 1 [Homarus americanus]
MAPPTKRMKYDASFKLKVVRFAKASNNSAVARESGINEKQVREWKKAEEKLIDIPRTKCALRRGKQQWPELEEKLLEWVNEIRESGYVITGNAICIYAMKLAKSNPDTGKDFKATRGWCSHFMNRKGLVLRQKSKIAQKLPLDLESKITCFQWYIIQIRRNHNFPLTCIGNMDGTPMNFDMISNRTVEAKGSKIILVKTTGHEKARFTVVLSCMTDGTKLKSMIIFKRKTMPKVKFPAGVYRYVHVHENGWMGEEVRLWLEHIWSRRKGVLRKERSLLVQDMFRSQLTEPVKKYLKKHNTDTAVIPGGFISVVQPLDVCLNKPFKDRVRDRWNKWMIEGEKTFTNGGNM